MLKAAVDPTCSGDTGPETEPITWSTFVTLIECDAVPAPPSPSVTVSETTYVPLSCGVKATAVTLLLAKIEPLTALPATVAQAVKDNATPNKISSAGTGTPNLLLYSIFGAAPPPPPPSDFSLSVSPSTPSLGRFGGSLAYTVTITRSGGFADSVSLSVSGLPTGTTGTFNPAATTGNSSTLTLTISSSTVKGTHTFTVSGTGATLTRTASASFTKSNGK